MNVKPEGEMLADLTESATTGGLLPLPGNFPHMQLMESSGFAGGLPYHPKIPPEITPNISTTKTGSTFKNPLACTASQLPERTKPKLSVSSPPEISQNLNGECQYVFSVLSVIPKSCPTTH